MRGYFGVRDSWRVFGLWKVVVRRTFRAFLLLICSQRHWSISMNRVMKWKTYAFEVGFCGQAGFGVMLATYRRYDTLNQCGFSQFNLCKCIFCIVSSVASDAWLLLFERPFVAVHPGSTNTSHQTRGQLTYSSCCLLWAPLPFLWYDGQ